MFAISPDDDTPAVSLAEFAASLGDHLTDSRTVGWAVVSTAPDGGDVNRVLWLHERREEAVNAAAQLVSLAEKYADPSRRYLLARVVLDVEL